MSLEEGDNEQSQYVRENCKVFENCLENNPESAKHTFFATGLSRELVAKNLCDKF